MAEAYDAVVVGAGPNGLAAAVALAQANRSVLVVEGHDQIGGGTRTAELTLPGFHHDVCSAIHPFGAASPFFRSLPLERHGLEWMHPEVLCAQPLDGGRAGALYGDLDRTVDALGDGGPGYRRLVGPLVPHVDAIVQDLLGPIRPPRHPVATARYGLRGLWPASVLRRTLAGEEARALLAGIAAHQMLPLSSLITGGLGLMFLLVGHAFGWPAARGGSQRVTEALAAHLTELGGVIKTGWQVERLEELPRSRVVLCDTSVEGLLRLAGTRLPTSYRRRLTRFRRGKGIFKVDWALDGPVPWEAEAVRQAGTVHLGGPFEETARAEREVHDGTVPERPYVLMAQQDVADPGRAPAGKRTLWAYCHVPNGCDVDMTERIEAQIERFAPGFRDLVLERRTWSPAQMERYNPNYVGGDVNGGAQDVLQFFARPTLRWWPYATPDRSLYLCSSSTPPGGGVHGMSGYYAAQAALRLGPWGRS